ncbi:LrgB family protein [Paenibacillus mendelii]|uniref:LrgB family protein n=1 Tax=Paenibacillus mendelii TaxID=206163 RepID=A0ABV6JJS8_9BACL|nr:LrgB family protein [Paenibacillus mendelii]MCQ6557966.1 LrgB family protein [Paenibacillus mendelii]
MSSSTLFSNPLFGTTVTVLAYGAALAIYAKVRWLHPLLSAPLIVYLVLLAGSIDYKTYNAGGSIVSFFLGPATVALAVPLYKQAMRLRPMLPKLLMGAFIGSVLGITVNALCVILLGGSKELLYAVLPKSVTAPVAADLASWLGGSPELAAALTVVTGLFGSIAGPPLLRLARVHDYVSASIAIGASSHGIGSAKLLADSEEKGGISSFSMAACAIFTPLLLIPVNWFIL